MLRRLPLLLALGLTACGASNSANTISTVTVTQPQASTSPTQTATSTPPRTSTGTTATPPRTTPTRTQAAPAFTGGAAAGSGAEAAAVAKLRALGFTPLGSGSYHADQTLRVLIGARSGSADDRTQRAFFFNGGRYLGTDTADTSAEIRVAAQSDTEVTLEYGIYRAGDALCCPHGGTRKVRFQLDMGRLMAVDPLPSAAGRR
ncbi:MAG: hypothetical protein NVSMB51_12600 [Solirubrobacteraceae bacterium]